MSLMEPYTVIASEAGGRDGMRGCSFEKKNVKSKNFNFSIQGFFVYLKKQTFREKSENIFGNFQHFFIHFLNF